MAATASHTIEYYFANTYRIEGKFDLPVVRRQKIDLDGLKLIRFSRTRPGLKQQKVSVSLPDWMVDSLDKEAARIGVTRQAVIKMWLDEKLEARSA
jgi:hypothetical protein